MNVAVQYPQFFKQGLPKVTSDICHRCFQLARKILVTCAIFPDISGPLLVSPFPTSIQNFVTFVIFAIFAIFVTGVFSSQEKFSLLLRLWRYLRTFRGSWLLLFLSLDSCQICYFCDICGHFGALLGFFSFKVLILVGFVILAIFAKKNLLANRLGTEHVFIRIKMVFFLYALVFWRSATTNKTTEHIQREERGYLRMKAYSSKFPRASYCCGFWIIKQCDTKCTQRCRANVTEKFCEFGQVGRQVGRLFI